MPRLSYDIHIHSCLSPCGDTDMLPSNIIGMSALKGLDVVALTDHNSCKNCPPFLRLAEEYGIIAIPGMEINTAEEVHALCLFSELKAALEFDKYVREHLVKIVNKPKIFGEQQIVDEKDNVIATEPFLLINATDIYFYDLNPLVKSYGGVMIPAHIDKSANSLIANLGFIPPDSDFLCAEVKHTGFLDKIKENNPYLKGCGIISDSDAHYLADINEPINFISPRERSVKSVLEFLAAGGGMAV